MPKLKTKKSAAKRYKVTANGKIKISKRGKRHLQTKKSAKRNFLSKSSILKKSETKRAKTLLPYS